MNDIVYYAIGDVHGEAPRLRALHEKITADHADHGGDSIVIHLGDYVDRGPDSAGVIDAIIALEAAASGRADFKIKSLKGNHEQLMLDAILKTKPGSERQWAFNGGEETLDSYVREGTEIQGDWRDLIPRAHVDWLKGLPTMYRDEARRLAFVHGGIDPETFPFCEDQVRMWTRADKFFRTETWPRRAELAGLTVVHGHTPRDDFMPDVFPRRINVDTGAVFGGKLTAAVLAPNQRLRFLQT
jgi:serine/threonine protein phosphatase 1